MGRSRRREMLWERERAWCAFIHARPARPGKPKQKETEEPEAPCAEWKALCADVRRLVLSKLSLRDLARAATMCREIREAYQTRIRQERADLITVGEGIFGKELFHTSVTGLQRTMCGLRPWPGVLCEGGGPGIMTEQHILFSTEGKPKCVTGSEAQSGPSCDGPCALIGEFLDSLWWNARLCQRRLANGAQVHPCADVFFEKFGGRIAKLEEGCEFLYWVHVEQEALVATVGFLMAVFTQNPGALPPCFPRNIAMHFRIRAQCGTAASVGKAAGLVVPVRAAEDFVAPLRPFVKSITIHPI